MIIEILRSSPFLGDRIVRGCQEIVKIKRTSHTKGKIFTKGSQGRIPNVTHFCIPPKRLGYA